MKKIMAFITISGVIIAQGYDTGWDAQVYTETAEQIQKNSTIKEFGDLLQLKKNDILIDFGAGDGTTSKWLAWHVAQVIMVEPSEKMMGAAISNTQEIKNVSTLLAKVEDISLVNYATKATLFWVDHWFENRPLAYKKIYDSLQNNGVLYIATMVNHSDVITSFDKIKAKDRWKNYFRNYENRFRPAKAGELKEVLEKTGFHVSLFQERLCQDSYPTREIMERQWYSVPFFAPVFDLADKEIMVREFLDDYIANHCIVHETGVINSNDEIVIAVCIKKS